MQGWDNNVRQGQGRQRYQSDAGVFKSCVCVETQPSLGACARSYLASHDLSPDRWSMHQQQQHTRQRY